MERIEPSDLEKDLETGSASEKRLRWDEAASFYASVVRSLGGLDASDRSGRALRAQALLRLANALRHLGRREEARRSLDEALHDAKGSEESDVIAQALLGAGVFAGEQGDAARAEAFLLEALARYHDKDARAYLQGRGWCLINLASLYGRTGRLDLAFVTFTKAQDVLGAAQNWAGVAAAWEAQAQLRRAIGDEERWREDLAEAVIFYDREGMVDKANRIRALLGRRVV